jgi:hypothetical protein
MGLFRTKIWHWQDIALLKGSCILFGMIAGAYLTDFIESYVWLFLLAAVLCAVRPALRYFSSDNRS